MGIFLTVSKILGFSQFVGALATKSPQILGVYYIYNLTLFKILKNINKSKWKESIMKRHGRIRDLADKYCLDCSVSHMYTQLKP